MIITSLILVLLAGLAAANGANDVSKGVATLAGGGVAHYRTAILWGAVFTLAGALVSGVFAGRMLKLFSSGIVSAQPTAAFSLAVICGTVGWVTVATLYRLPVSTTHAIIGALLGTGLLFAPGAIAWSSLVPRLAAPLVLSIVASYGLSAIFNRVFARQRSEVIDCLCVGTEQLDAGVAQITQTNVIIGTTKECASAGGYLRLNPEILHWLSSGAVSFARGLNDTPKLIAIAIGVLGPNFNMSLLIVLAAAAMFGGGLYGGMRVARLLAEKVVRMDHREGLLANLATALLVGVGANLGLPTSTTHVSTGAIAGIAGGNTRRLDRRTIRDLALAWTVTPVIAGSMAGISYFLIARLAS